MLNEFGTVKMFSMLTAFKLPLFLLYFHGPKFLTCIYCFHPSVLQCLKSNVGRISRIYMAAVVHIAIRGYYNHGPVKFKFVAVGTGNFLQVRLESVLNTMY